MSYQDRVETDWAFRIQLPVGSHVPFHCTASGKCFMASLPPRTRRRFVESLALTPLTPATLSDRERLIEDLAEIARRGYSLDAEEFMEGMVAIAVPVTDPEGRFIAALAFHGPVQRVSIAAAEARLGMLQEAATRLSAAVLPEG
jgi:DNA-binding IclR family transcriptional regulator